jgi:hypothetical protein
MVRACGACNRGQQDVVRARGGGLQEAGVWGHARRQAWCGSCSGQLPSIVHRPCAGGQVAACGRGKGRYLGGDNGRRLAEVQVAQYLGPLRACAHGARISSAGNVGVRGSWQLPARPAARNACRRGAHLQPVPATSRGYGGALAARGPRGAEWVHSSRWSAGPFPGWVVCHATSKRL